MAACNKTKNNNLKSSDYEFRAAAEHQHYLPLKICVRLLQQKQLLLIYCLSG